MKLEQRIYDTITRHRMISRGDAVVVGVSGGPDSVALLHLLNALKGRLGCALTVAHFDHGIRGGESRDDGLFVQELAEQLDLPFHAGQENLTAHAETGKRGNLEARARAARYRFFESVAHRVGATRIGVGHTQDDQVETMIMWLLRGCGAAGLGGMPAVRAADSPQARRTLIRPLIDVSRSDIVQFLEAEGLSFRCDRTNADTRYLRNWIRADLLPALVERTDGRLGMRLARLSALLQDDARLLERYVSQAVRRVVRDGAVSCAAFLALEPELRGRVLRSWLQSHLGDLRGLGFHHVESALRLATARHPSGYASLPGGWTVVRDYDALRLMRGCEAARAEPYVYELPLEGEVRVEEAGVTVRAWCAGTKNALTPENLFQAAFDRRAVEGVRELRSRLPGDRFRPLGMKGRKKVKDLFIEKKTPRPLRDRLPLVLVDGEVLWIPGYGRSAAAKVAAGTREVWNLEVSGIDLPPIGSY